MAAPEGDPVANALIAHLTAASAVAGMLSAPGAVFHKHAPLGAQQPLVIVHREHGDDRYLFGDGSWQGQRWVVKAATLGRTDQHGTAADLAADIADAINDALHDADLAIAGHRVMWCRREQIVDYDQLEDKSRLWNFAGGVYRIDIEPT